MNKTRNLMANLVAMTAACSVAFASVWLVGFGWEHALFVAGWTCGVCLMTSK